MSMETKVSAQESVNATAMVASASSMSRQQMHETYGSWYSESATPAELVSWCDARIAVYKQWIKGCARLKSEMQSRVLEGLDPMDRLVGLSPEQLEQIQAYLSQKVA